MLSLKPITAIPSPARTNARNWSHVTSGMPGVGSPVGTGPTMATPCSSMSASTQTTVAVATAIRVAGQRGRRKWTASSSPSVPMPTASVVRWVSSTTSRKERSWETMLSPSTFVPVILPNCPTIISTAAPAR